MKIRDLFTGKKKAAAEGTAPAQKAPPMKEQGAASGASAPAQEAPPLETAFRGIPFQAGLDVSPDEGLVCFVTPEETIAAYESGSDHPRWTLAVPASRNTTCRFVGPERLLVLSPPQKDEPLVPLIQLVNTADGSVITEKMGPKMSMTANDADPGTGTYVANGFSSVVSIQTAGDRIEISTWACDQIDTGPKIGPDGKCYLTFFARGLHRIEGNQTTRLMPGGNWIHFEAPSTVYCGDGHLDRSGPSALHTGDLVSGATSAVPWGSEPVSRIEPAGPGRLLIGSSSGGTMSRRDNAVVTLFSLAESRKVWSRIIDGLPQFRNALLTSAPEEGWAFIQTGDAVKLISLEDGKTLRRLPKDAQQWTWAKWLASRRLLYYGGNRYKEQPGLLECYRI